MSNSPVTLEGNDRVGREAHVSAARCHRSPTLRQFYPVDLLRRREDALVPPRPNLAAWREVLHELDGNPAREAVAVFVADLDDPVTSEADGSMRATFEGHEPVL